jgi:hypothetical protein
MLICVEWFAWFFYLGFNFNYVPAFGTDQTQVLGTIIFNYAYVISIPSWVNEKVRKFSEFSFDKNRKKV